jgi:hypothetical protein
MPQNRGDPAARSLLTIANMCAQREEGGTAAMATTSKLRCPRSIVFCALAVLGCSSDASEPIVGSGHLTESRTATSRVERVSVSLPFEATLWNGEDDQVLVRGEDNLIAEITVEEIAPGEWLIAAPFDMAFEQHMNVEIEIPYIHMVALWYEGNVILGEHPSTVWNQPQR